MRLLLFLFLLPWFAYSQPGVTRIGSPNGTTVIQGGIGLTENTSATSISSNQNNYTLPNYSTWNVNATTDVEFTGFTAVSGKRVEIVNRGTGTITLKNLDGSSSASNQLSLPGSIDYAISPGNRLSIKYSDYDSKWIINFSSELGTITLPPPTSAPALSMYGVSSSGFNLAVIKGSGGQGVMAVVSESPISWTPAANTSYASSVNTNFGSGNDVSGGDGVYAVLFGNVETFGSAVITGLDPATTYYIAGFEFVNQGSLYSYSPANTNNITTLSNASTPTTQFNVTAIIPEQEQIRIKGTRGNGDDIIVLASTEGQPDTDPTDNTDYDVDDVIGNAKVAYEGTASDFHITGYERDRMVWIKVMERETTGNLYNTQTDVDSVWTDFITDSLFVTANPSDGQVYLESGLLFYDFTQGTVTGDVSNGNPGLVDQSGNGHTGTIVSTPDLETQTIGAYSGVHSLETASGESTGISTGDDGSSFFSQDFEIFFDVTVTDGQPAADLYFCGTTHSSFTDIFRVRINGSGNLIVRYANGGNNGEWTSTSAVFANGANAHAVFRIKMDFTTDTFGAWKDGGAIAGSFTTGSMAALTPASFASDRNFNIGNQNTAGAAPTTFLMSRFAITGLSTSQEALDAEAYMGYLPTVSGSGLNDWTKINTNGFTVTTTDDTLRISGQPTGFQDYIVHNDVLPDTLEKVDIKFVLKIDDDLVSGDVGIGPMLINDTSTEPNRGVYCLFITNPASANFGKIQIYSGNGTVSGTDVSFRSVSSGAFTPAKDSTYLLELKRTIEDDANARYTFTVTDLSDTTAAPLTTSWLGVGAPQSEYLGTTLRSGIWMNGGTFAVNPFRVSRTGLGGVNPGSPGGGGGSPGTVVYEVVVLKGGNDANDCTQEEPCLTIVRGAERVDELGPGTDMFIGPGTFVETSNIFWSTDLDTLDGAGPTQTIIKGASNLYTQITTGSGSGNPFSSGGYLFNFNSTSSTDVTTVMRNFTMEGNRDVGSYAASMKGGIRIANRDQINMDNVDIKHFWNVGLWAQDVDSLVYRNGHVYRNGFSNVAGATYSLGNLEFFGTNINIWVINSLIDSPVFDEGRGIGHSGAPNFFRFDFHGHGNEFILGGSSDPNDGDHHFSFEFLQYFMLSGDSISFTNNIFHKNVSMGYTGTQAGVHYFHNNRFTFDLPKNLAIEAQGPNFIICHNHFSNISGKAIGTYNGWGPSVQNPHCPRDCHAANEVWQGMTIENNIFEMVASTVSGDPIWGDQLWRRDDVFINQNTVAYTTTSGQPYRLVRGGTQGVNDNWIIQNTAIHGAIPSGSTVFSTANGSGTFTNSFFRYNKATNLDVTQLLSGSGMSESNNTVTGSGNTLLFNLTGSKFPILQNSYYGWTTNAVLNGTGQSSADIGAYEN